MPELAVVAPDAAGAAALAGLVAGAQVRAVLVGGEPDASLRASEVVVVRGLDYISPPDVLGPALRGLLDADVVVLDSSQPSRDLAGWATAALGRALVWAVDAVRVVDDEVEAERIVLGGSHRLVHQIEGRAVVMARPSGVPAGPGSAPATVRVVDATPGASRTRVVERAPRGAGLAPLSGARVVVSVGRGIGGPENIPLFRELAERLGAGLGATRAVVDAGWLPFCHQVGQTGAVVAPELYLAFGVSGAPQHLAGMRASKRVVAVNTDPEAPLCRLADVAVVGDAVEVARSLLERISVPARTGGA